MRVADCGPVLRAIPFWLWHRGLDENRVLATPGGLY